MIERYSRPRMQAIFADQSRMDRWLAVEKASLHALVDEGLAPMSAAAALDCLRNVDVDQVAAREAEIHHDLAAFVDVIAAAAPESAGWLHYGLTSSDVVDTALAMQLRDAADEILAMLDVACAVVLERAREHASTVMLGRTHGMPAEVITFGAKLLGWWHTLQRDHARISASRVEIAVGKLSGAVGLYTGVPASVERHVLAVLGLGHDASATQIVQRDRHASLLTALAVCASNLDRFAVEIRHLQRADVGEVAEPFGHAQKGSSAMPHKRNPIVSERISGLARIVRSCAQVGLENIVLWHERDISHSSAERVVLPDAMLALDYMLDRFIWVMSGLTVDSQRMIANIDRERGLVCSQRVLLALIETGLDRDVAYRHVQECAASVHEGLHPDLARALEGNEAVHHALGVDRIIALCNAHLVPYGVRDLFEAVGVER